MLKGSKNAENEYYEKVKNKLYKTEREFLFIISFIFKRFPSKIFLIGSSFSIFKFYIDIIIIYLVMDVLHGRIALNTVWQKTSIYFAQVCNKHEKYGFYCE